MKCIGFELRLSSRTLALSTEDGGEDWYLEDDHLAKMMEITGQIFSPR